MTDIDVNVRTLASGEQHVRNSYAKLVAALDQLESDLQPMISAWSRPAQESYLAAKRKWGEATQALSAVLNNVSPATGDVQGNYTAAENAARSNWV